MAAGCINTILGYPNQIETAYIDNVSEEYVAQRN